ncbi:universal stress protein UspA and related nucleotide-binding proteins [Aquitalea magnusonii]|jgi:nucleotide-binding universal stress UspA family protein|uniref:Universal stress protein n=1 Tax=Aquitalea magnusonii TaxID=332411 RepID=A0A3G9GQ42_9NEIS|nr:universal stress protein [Aquitalea magnusonii]BBF87801.1 universal stress protein UspA and related nucleotide-binding proteins [Aquitalea magnusonii]
MYQHIVIAVDGSKTAEKALDEAIRIAKIASSAISLVHVASLRDMAIEGVGALDTHQLHDLAFRQARDLLDKAQKRAINEGVSRVDCHIAESWEGGKDMADALIRFADSRHAELIVIGTHGRTGLAHLLLGSFAENVMRKTHCPLLVVRGSED